MGYIFKNLIALIGMVLLGVGIANANPTLDCGDDEAQPINVQSAAIVTNKES